MYEIWLLPSSITSV